uniref:Outer dense fiber of sperm tails 3-like 2a n=1 Tax=Cyprinus carpio carpio TaxID=630221 RepID=A0A8C1HXC6_CYPCA
MSAGPGPGRYALPPTIGYINHDYTKPSSPAYSFHSRMSSNSDPGPQYHVDAKMTRFGRDGTPSYSMLGRKKKTGGFSSDLMLDDTYYELQDPVPAPNRYTLPNLFGSHIPHKAASASFTMSARRKAGGPSEDLSMTPGPGRYNSTEPSVYLNRQPSFSLQSRCNIPTDATRKPGPGTHSPEKVTAHLPRAPSFSMGVRHSEFVTPLIVDVLD